MNQGDALRETAKIVEALEAAGVVVEDVSVSDDGDDGTPLDLRLRVPDGALDLPVLQRGGTSTRRSVAGGTRNVPADEDRAHPAGDRETPADDRATPADDGQVTPVDDAAADDGRTGEGDAGERTADAGTTSVDAASADGANSTDLESTAGSVPCRVDGCDETFGSDQGMKIHVAKSHGDDGNAPAHRNPERLVAVYERHDTFEDMRDALGVDVTAQTVRRNMMNHGIHDPEEGSPDGANPDHGGDADDGEDVDDEANPEDDPDLAAGIDGERPATTDGERPAATDGGALAAQSGGTDGSGDDAPEDSPIADSSAADLDLPADVGIEAFVRAVADARTLFDVQRSLDLDRAEAQTLLAELDLLAFVHGRVADQEHRCASVEEVERRLRERIEGG